jgi:hypothetical protein
MVVHLSPEQEQELSKLAGRDAEDWNAATS